MTDKTMDDVDIVARAERYVADEPEAVFRNEIRDLIDRQARADAAARADLRERFSSNLAFGTGGLRGVIGGGSNRLNPLAVRRSTQGLADYLKRAAPGALSAVIAHDSRRYSEHFAREAALVLAANGIKTYLFSDLQPTPVLSFMVRRLKAGTGIVITASHNPPEYNGYKVYWDDGAQILGSVDEGISDAIGRVTGPIGVMEEDEAIRKGLLVRLGEDSLEPYYAMVVGRMLRREEVSSRRGDLLIVYTPLHGTGLVPVTTLFNRLGYSFTVVKEQSPPDGNFTNAPVPNPENPAAFHLAFALTAKTGAGLVLATDPDADRLGVAVPDGQGFRLFSGNEVGVLLLDYILETRAEQKKTPAPAYVVKTIVTSDLQRRIAEAHGVLCLDTLTGFKYICGVMRDLESEKPDYECLLGNEESCGYLIETDARDKDGVSAAALVAEMAVYYKTKNKTLIDRLNEIEARHGRFVDFQVSKTFPGSAGMAIIARLMAALRRSPAALAAGRRLAVVKDYLAGTTADLTTGTVKRDLRLPASDVMQLILDDGSLLTARPSGTEPKIKFYASLHIDPPFAAAEAEEILKAKGDAVRAAIDSFVAGNSK